MWNYWIYTNVYLYINVYLYLYLNIDINTNTTNVILPEREKGGSVLKLGLFNGSSAIITGDFPVKSKLNAHFVGNNSSRIEEKSNTSVKGESLCFTIVFKTSPVVSANADISTHVNIIIHESGHSYKVGDEITLDGQQFVGPPSELSKFGKPCKNKNLILKVLAVNK